MFAINGSILKRGDIVGSGSSGFLSPGNGLSGNKADTVVSGSLPSKRGESMWKEIVLGRQGECLN